MEKYIYLVSLIVFFGISLRVLMALHIERKFEKMRVWEIKVAYFLGALILGHMLAEIVIKISNLFIETL